MEEGVLFALKGNLKGFCGTAHVCIEDLDTRKVPEDSLEKGVRLLSRGEIDRMLARKGQA